MFRNAAILLGLPLMIAACELAPVGPAVPGAEETVMLSQGVGAGLVRTTWPSENDPGMPFYARIGEDQILNVDGWVVVAFYRDPDCIPLGFNLLDFFDAPAAFGCPHTVKGSTLWHGAPFSGAPKIIQADGTGAVPYWFIPVEEVLEAMEDGVLTVGELAALPGRLEGHATHFTEMLHPHPNPPFLGGGGHSVPKLIQNAQGRLTDGSRFQYHITTVDGGGGTIRLRFW